MTETSSTTTVEAGFAALDRPPTLSMQAYRKVKDSIITGVFAPASLATEAGLARQFGISRAPLREAMRMLQEEGLVEQTSAAGFSVSPLNSESIAEVYGVRFALEGFAARLAAGNIPTAQIEMCSAEVETALTLSGSDAAAALRESDFRFHDLWVRNAGNELLTRHIGRLRDHVLRIAHHVQMPDAHFSASLAEHTDILAAIRSGGADALQASVEAHISSVRDRILAQVGPAA